MYQIVQTENRGKVMLATEKLEPGPFGLQVLKEEALLTVPTRGSPTDKSGKAPAILEQGEQMWTDWYTYLQQPEEIKQRILEMYSELDCKPATFLRDYLYKKQQERFEQEEKGQDEDLDGEILDHIEEFVKFAMVIRFNSVEMIPPREDGSGPGKDFGHGLFEKACKMSHSCKPNCVWKSTQDGKAKEIRAISTVEEGEELTVDYVGDLLDPIPQRREELMMTKGFLCQCTRCSGKHGDDTRRFKCSKYESTNCPGVHFLNQPLLESKPELFDCTHCGAQAPESYLRSAIIQETRLVTELNDVDKCADEGGLMKVSDRIARLNPPHQLHCLAEKCYQLQAELYNTTGDHRKAAEAYAKQIMCRNAILGESYNSQATAFCCEKLGDALSHVNVEEAEKAYKRTFRTLQKMRGGCEDPYTNCSLDKLVKIQNRRVHTESDKLPLQSGLDGIAEPPGPKVEYPCALCGMPTKENICCTRNLHYCCEEHKAMHLSRVYERKPSDEIICS